MKSAWSESDARAAVSHFVASEKNCNKDLALRVYSSRLIGKQPDLVLHGGGNTSVKTQLPDDLGQPVDVLCVKGSGWDLGSIEPAGFPAVRLDTLAALRKLPELSDEAMVNAARTRLLDAQSPNPSVEALLHAFLPHRFIDHSHADAILAVADQAEAEEICREVFGDTVAVVPYVMPGFVLAKLAAEVYEANPNTHGLVLLQHGLFTYADTARESYERHITLVSQAQAHVARRRSGATSRPARAEVDYRQLAPVLRGRLGQGARRYVLTVRTGPKIRDFVDDPELASLSGRGPATPDHVIRTKQKPMLLDPQAVEASLAEEVDRRLEAYRDAYRSYVATQIEAKGVERTPLDPDPRIVLVPGLGLVAAGATPAAAHLAADIYEHTIDVIRDAEVAGRYQALGDADIFDMEYWSLEQAKLGKKQPKPLQAQVVYITGAGSGIGSATARQFRAAGANVYLVDRDAAALDDVGKLLGCPTQVVDVTDADAVRESLGRAVNEYGGLDGIVSNAGNAPQGAIYECSGDVLRESLDLNLLSHQWVASEAVGIMRRQGSGGFLLFNASKAAFNPGPRFGPYAIAKAALVALMRQYAIEAAAFGIRSNAINADRVRTGLLPSEVVEARARARGLDSDAYFRSNLLGREVTAEDVGDAFVALAQSESTTGTVLTVDGGNIAAAPR